MNFRRLLIYNLLICFFVLHPKYTWCSDLSFEKAIKKLGEQGGKKHKIIELIGNPKFIEDFVVTDSESYMTGPAPQNCQNISRGDTLTVWAYPTEEEGFYQLILKGDNLVCLRWKSGNEPFGGIETP